MGTISSLLWKVGLEVGLGGGEGMGMYDREDGLLAVGEDGREAEVADAVGADAVRQGVQVPGRPAPQRHPCAPVSATISRGGEAGGTRFEALLQVLLAFGDDGEDLEGGGSGRWEGRVERGEGALTPGAA